MPIVSTFDSSQALRKGILRDSTKSDTQTLPYDDLVIEFQECVKLWDASDNGKKLKRMFGGIRDKIELADCVVLGLTGFSKRTLVSVEGGYARIVNPSMHQLVCLSKLLPMLSECGPIGVQNVNFFNPRFTGDEKKLLQKLPFKYLDYVSDLDPRRALEKMSSYTFFFAINLDDMIGCQFNAELPGLYMGTKMDTLIQAKQGYVDRMNKKDLYKEFKDRSEAVEIQNLNDETWTTSGHNEIRYLTKKRDRVLRF